MHYKETEFGFEYGSVAISRCCSDEKKGWVVIQLTTPKDILDVYVTKSGKITVTSRNLGDLRPRVE